MSQAEAPAVPGLDLSAFTADPNDITHRVPLAFDKDGKAIAGYVIVGRNSDAYQAEEKRQRVESIKRRAAGEAAIDTKTDSGARQLDDLVEQDDINIACAVVVDWFGVTKDGQPVPFDEDVAHGAIRRNKDHRDLIFSALRVGSNFLPQPSAS
jgi:hypothetical protein